MRVIVDDNTTLNDHFGALPGSAGPLAGILSYRDSSPDVPAEHDSGRHCHRAAAVGDVAAGCSFQLSNQAIHSNQNSESEMHPHQGNEHQDSQLGAHSLCYQQKNNRAGETGERSSDANNKLCCPILRHPGFLAVRGDAARARGPIVRRGFAKL